MPDDLFRYRPEEVRVTERTHLNEASGSAGGGSGGASGGGASSGGSGGSSGGGGGSSGSNESRENPSYTGRGDSRNNQAQSQPYMSQGVEQPNTSTGSSRTQNEQPQHQRGNQPNQSNGSQSQNETPMTHSYCPPTAVVAGGFPITPFGAGYGYPYAGYGAAPAAGAPVTTVVTGQDGNHGKGISAQIETLSDIALGGLRESAATGRTNQLSTQIEGIGERLDAQAGFGRELHVQREFTAAQKDRGDLENRLMTALKDESIRTRQMFTDDRIRSLENENANLRDSRRFQELDNDLSEIKRLLRERSA